MLGGIKDDRLEAFTDNSLDRLIVGFRDRLRLEVRLNRTINNSVDVVAQVVLVELLCFIKRPTLASRIQNDYRSQHKSKLNAEAVKTGIHTNSGDLLAASTELGQTGVEVLTV